LLTLLLLEEQLSLVLVVTGGAGAAALAAARRAWTRSESSIIFTLKTINSIHQDRLGTG
jgi:hypothetical protein